MVAFQHGKPFGANSTLLFIQFISDINKCNYIHSNRCKEACNITSGLPATSSNGLVYFTTRVPDTSKASATRATQVQHNYNMSITSVTRVKTYFLFLKNSFSFLKKFIFFVLREFIILDFVNFPTKNTSWKKMLMSYQQGI